MGNYKVDNQNSDQSTDQTSSDQSSADSRFSNRSPDELVLNAMLRDFLKRNLPPNFENRILASLVSRRTSNSVLLNKRSFTEDELDAALGAALADIEFGQQSSHDRVASSFEEKWIKRMDPYWWDYKRVRTVAAFIGLAASLCFAYLFIPKPDWFPWNKTVPNEGDFLAEASAFNPNVENEKQELATPDVFPSDETPLPETVAVVPPPVIEASVDLGLGKTNAESPSEPRMSRFEMANIVDSQIDHIWSNFNVKGKEDNSVDLWISRVTQTAIGRQPTVAEKESFRIDKSGNPKAAYVERLVDSEEFSIHWGTLLAEHYLGASIPANRSRVPELLRFVEWIQSSIQRKQSLVDVEVALVSSNTQPNDPASYWVSEQMKTGLMVEPSFVSASKVKLRVAQKGDIPIVNVASTLLHRTGNPWATCTQCHSSDSQEIATFSQNASSVAGNYWSFPAVVEKMIEKRKENQEDPGRLRKDRDFFYEDNDGKLVLAPPALTVKIDGKERVTGELGEWIRLSAQARSGVAEFVWTQIVQQPLVPVYGLSDTEARAERTDLKELLSKQLHATGSLQELVASLLLSKAMVVAEAKLTTQWYMNATEDLLSNYQRSARLFAFAPSSQLPASASSQKSVNQIVGWLKAKGNSTNPTLAQPSAFQSQAATKKKPELDEVSKLRFLISVDAPYANLDRFASVVSKSKLSWDDQLSHVYMLTIGRYPTAIERAEANRLLESTGNDARKAIVLVATNKLGSF
jgi:hypothetical protein